MVAKKNRYSFKTRGRMFVFFLFFIFIIATLGYTMLNNLKQINDIRIQKDKLYEEKNRLKEKQESLLADIEKLSDKDYIARYAREKYFYSRPGEIVLRIDED